jgi:magnesium transporter
MPPGSLVHVGTIKTSKPVITLIEYNAGFFRQTRFTSREQGLAYVPRPDAFLWLNVHGLQDTDLLRDIGQRFGLHPLVLEDILNTDQRPKLDDYRDYSYIVARVLEVGPGFKLASHQVSLVLGRQFVLTFQEKPTGTFNALRERLQAETSQIRRLGVDYLAYALLDSVVDSYFGVIEQCGEQIEALEENVIAQPQLMSLARIHAMKSDMLVLRRALWPLREVLNQLQRDDADLFTPDTQLYLRDVYDHAVHLIESLEGLRDLIAGLLDIYVSAQSNRLNKEMRLLTVITTIFMPLTLISSIYGMNFKHMPELEWHWGYYAVLLAMLVIVGLMLGWFWRRGWLQRS